MSQKQYQISQVSIVQQYKERLIKTMRSTIVLLLMVTFMSVSYGLWMNRVVAASNKEIKEYKAQLVQANKEIALLQKAKPTVINRYYYTKAKPQEIYVTVTGNGNLNVSTDSPGITVVTKPEQQQEPVKQQEIKSEVQTPEPKVEEKKEDDTQPKVWPNGDPMWDPYPGVYDQQGNRVNQ